MSKKRKRPILTFVALAAVAGGIFAWYKTKKAKEDKEDEFSDIFEEEDFDFDDTL